MRICLAAVVVVLLAGGALWLVTPSKPVAAVKEYVEDKAPAVPPRQFPGTSPRAAVNEAAAEPEAERNDATFATEAAPAPPRPVALAAMAEPPQGPEPAPGLTPVTVMENVRTTFRNYSSRYGGNPVGTNQEITKMLKGANPGNTPFLQSEDGLEVNGWGELVDNWGTPFFFHQLSRTEMEIHSAGPDRRMWTADDLVMK